MLTTRTHQQPRTGIERMVPSGPCRPRRVAATMYRLDDDETEALARTLGCGWVIEDGRSSEKADLVIVRPCSPQTLAGLSRRFPLAGVVAFVPVGAAGWALAPVSRSAGVGGGRYAVGVGQRSPSGPAPVGSSGPPTGRNTASCPGRRRTRRFILSARG
jgi:hypothetical protein